MRLDNIVFALTLFASAWAAAVDTGLHGSDVAFLAPKAERDNSQHDEKLWKRKGGGGGGGGRGGSSGSGGSRSGGSGGGSSTSRGGARDNAGGATRSGSGPAPAYGGGKYYGGGAAVPYRAGAARGSMAPFFLVGGAALAFWPGLWLTGAHMYPYSHPYRYYNETARENQTKAVLCGCAESLPCGCEENNATDYMNSLLGNGSYNALNKSVVNIGEVNGTETILINGTLPNGTTAAGGDEEIGSVAFRTAVETLGFWPVAVVVLATVFAA
ncbi:glycine-rich protein [Colletotrichum incanum]|uniref:Glycine-rich protein n=1 Tax=Colletotrichum incanum TaxID=1573173 RepID=A0A161W8K2_COLIC|nr:glycine-rich protein [Colletotrichum incanum]